MDKEEIEKARDFLDEMDIYGCMYTALGREKYIIENVFKPIQQLEEREQKVKELIKQLEVDEQNTRNIKNNEDCTIKNGRFVNYVDDYRRCRLKAYITKTREIKNRLLNLYNDKEG